MKEEYLIYLFVAFLLSLCLFLGVFGRWPFVSSQFEVVSSLPPPISDQPTDTTQHNKTTDPNNTGSVVVGHNTHVHRHSLTRSILCVGVGGVGVRVHESTRLGLTQAHGEDRSTITGQLMHARLLDCVSVGSILLYSYLYQAAPSSVSSFFLDRLIRPFDSFSPVCPVDDDE